jgi:LacI family transcriptional regulator
MKKVTIREVAEVAGVSAMTVSRVLNDRPDVSDETRQRVQQIIDDLGYRPSAVARSLIQGESHTLGIVGFGLEYFGPSSTLVGIERQAAALGYSLLVSLMHSLETRREVQQGILDNLLSRQVDGIIWAVPEHENNRDWLCAQVHDLATPVVFLNMAPRAETTMVAVDNYAGAQLATGHLLAGGYSRVGLITGPLTWWEAQQRQQGWRDTLEEAGLPWQGLAVEGDWSAASGEAGMHALLDRAPDLRAVFASNDQMALGALQAARQAGRRVPADLAVVGFDDIPEAAYFCPPLTTIRQDLLKLGTHAVQLLQKVLEAQKNGDGLRPEVVWVEPELIVRDSSVVA